MEHAEGLFTLLLADSNVDISSTITAVPRQAP